MKKKGLLKILIVALAAASIASFSVMPAFAAPAAPSNVWNFDDTAITTVPSAFRGTITASNITAEDGLTVAAYQLVDGKYQAYGAETKLIGYASNTGVTISNLEEPTASEIADVAAKVNAQQLILPNVKMSLDSGNYTAQVEPGLYLILVTGSNTKIYNPAIVALNVNDTATGKSATNPSVSFNDYFDYPSNAYLKSQAEPTISKTVVGSSENNQGDTVAYGDSVSFKIESKIPSYSELYKDDSLVFDITDTMASAFEGVTSLAVKVGTTTNVPATSGADKTYTVTYYTDSTLTEVAAADKAKAFKISFDKSYIRDNGNLGVEVTYSTTFKGDGNVNFAENKNSVSLKYTNSPEVDTHGEPVDPGETKDNTYHYTFGINANIDGQDETQPNPGDATFTPIIKKVEKDGEVTDPDTGVTTTTYKALAGAKFGLFTDSSTTTLIKDSTSDDKGNIQFLGLDEGTYYLKELEAPGGYSLSDNIYKIVIAASLNATTGVLESYSITTYDVTNADDKATDITNQIGTASFTNTGTISATDGSVTNAIAPSTITTAEILNTKLASLPATGGAGTIAITVGASLGMAAFLTVHVVNKKKQKEND